MHVILQFICDPPPIKKCFSWLTILVFCCYTSFDFKFWSLFSFTEFITRPSSSSSPDFSRGVWISEKTPVGWHAPWADNDLKALPGGHILSFFLPSFLFFISGGRRVSPAASDRWHTKRERDSLTHTHLHTQRRLVAACAPVTASRNFDLWPHHTPNIAPTPARPITAAMGRKKIQIQRITDERNRQVSAKPDCLQWQCS